MRHLGLLLLLASAGCPGDSTPQPLTGAAPAGPAAAETGQPRATSGQGAPAGASAGDPGEGERPVVTPPLPDTVTVAAPAELPLDVDLLRLVWDEALDALDSERASPEAARRTMGDVPVFVPVTDGLVDCYVAYGRAAGGGVETALLVGAARYGHYVDADHFEGPEGRVPRSVTVEHPTRGVLLVSDMTWEEAMNDAQAAFASGRPLRFDRSPRPDGGVTVVGALEDGPTYTVHVTAAHQQAFARWRAVANLLAILSAASLYREQDRDGNGVADYPVDLAALRDSGLLPAHLQAAGPVDGYTFDFASDPTNREFVCVAVATPLDGGLSLARANGSNVDAVATPGPLDAAALAAAGGKLPAGEELRLTR